MKKVLVTGGAGFIGANLCKYLLSKNYTVYCLDNFYSSSKTNISSLKQYSNFSLIEHNICEPICLENKIDEIYHLACPASPKYYQLDHINTLTTCFQGTLNILDLAAKHKAKVLFTSTSEIYGDPLVHPQVESYLGNVNPIGPRSCYDEGKRVAESLMVNYHLQKNIDIRIARIFNTYGPLMNEDDGRVVSNFIVSALNDDAIIIHGDGSQTRSFCYVDDMVQGLYSLMNCGEYLGPTNLGNPHEITINQLLNLVLKFTSSTSKVSYTKSRIDDPTQRKPNIEKALQTLNWQPKIDLETGLQRTIQYFSNEKFIPTPKNLKLQHA